MFSEDSFFFAKNALACEKNCSLLNLSPDYLRDRSGAGLFLWPDFHWLLDVDWLGRLLLKKARIEGWCSPQTHMSVFSEYFFYSA